MGDMGGFSYRRNAIFSAIYSGGFSGLRSTSWVYTVFLVICIICRGVAGEILSCPSPDSPYVRAFPLGGRLGDFPRCDFRGETYIEVVPYVRLLPSTALAQGSTPDLGLLVRHTFLVCMTKCKARDSAHKELKLFLCPGKAGNSTQ